MSETTNTELGAEVEDVVVLPEGQEVEKPAQREQGRRPKFSGVDDEDADLPVRVQKRMAVYAKRSYETQSEIQRERAARLAAERALAEHMKQSLAGTDENLDRQFKDAQARHQRAFTEGDGETVAASSAELAQIAAKRIDVQRQAQQIQVPTRQPQEEAPQVSPRTRAFIEANPWFEGDPVARELAIVSHAQALKRGIQAETPEYFDFVTKRVRAVFPEHFEGEPEPEETLQRAAPTPPVASARRTVPGMSNGKPRLPSLTAEEAAQAKRMGVSLQDWAVEKALIAASRNNQ